MIERIQITVQYHNILRARAGIVAETLDLPAGITLRELLQQVTETHGPVLREVLFTAEGAVSADYPSSSPAVRASKCPWESMVVPGKQLGCRPPSAKRTPN